MSAESEFGGPEDQVIQAARIVQLALGQSAAMASKLSIPVTEIWPIAEYILERATQASDEAELDQKMQEAREMLANGVADPVLARFVAGEVM